MLPKERAHHEDATEGALSFPIPPLCPLSNRSSPLSSFLSLSLNFAIFRFLSSGYYQTSRQQHTLIIIMNALTYSGHGAEFVESRELICINGQLMQNQPCSPRRVPPRPWPTQDLSSEPSDSSAIPQHLDHRHHSSGTRVGAYTSRRSYILCTISRFAGLYSRQEDSRVFDRHASRRLDLDTANCRPRRWYTTNNRQGH